MLEASKCIGIESEFETVDFGDQRLNKRVKEIARDLSQSPKSSIPKATQTWARTKGAYRFFEHPDVTSEKILAPHREATLERMGKEKTILMVQDTTSLQYASQQAGSGLGLLGNRGDKALGMWLHSTLAINEHGTTSGIVDVQTWVRDPKEAGIAARRKERAFKDKESHRWVESFDQSVRLAALLPEAQVINVADREGDIYQLFAEASRHSQVGVLVRARPQPIYSPKKRSLCCARCTRNWQAKTLLPSDKPSGP